MSARVLFVCLGNICRSPTAEGVLQHLVDAAGADVEIDSAGTSAHHVGERADARMRRHASQRGYDLTSRSRQVTASDFARFDHIIAMDDSNLRALQRRCPAEHARKLAKLTDWCTEHDATEVPDPYYGGPAGFEEVLDLVEDGASHLLRELTR